MPRARLLWMIPVALVIVAATVSGIVAVSAADPPLVAQAGTVAPGASPGASPIATAPAASVPSGTAIVPSVAIPTAAAASVVPPPSIPPPIDTSSGPSQQEVLVTVIGIAAAVVFIAAVAWGLVRLIATAGVGAGKQ